MPWTTPPPTPVVAPRRLADAVWPPAGPAGAGLLAPPDPLLAVRLARRCVDEAVLALLVAVRAEWVSVAADRCRAELADQLRALHALDRLLDDAAVAAARERLVGG